MSEPFFTDEDAKAGREDEALSSLDRALQLVVEEAPYAEGAFIAVKHGALSEIAIQYAAASRRYERAIETANMREDEQTLNGALLEIVSSGLGAGDTEEAIRAIPQLKDAFYKTYALTEASERLARDGEGERASSLLSEALRANEEIKWTYQRVLALATIARRYAETGVEGRAAELLLQALQLTYAIESKYHQALALARLAEDYREAGLKNDERAKRILREIVDKLDG